MTKSAFKKSVARAMSAVLAVVLSASLAGSSSLPVHAETTLERLQRAKEEKEKTEEAKDDTQERKDSLQITKNSLLGELGTLNDNLAEVSANLEKIEADIVTKEAEITQAQADLEQAKIVEQEQYANMKLRIKTMYESGASYGYLNFLFNSESFADFLNKSDYIEQINLYDQKMLRKYEESRKDVELKQAQGSGACA